MSLLLFLQVNSFIMYQIIIALLIPFAGTVIGSAFVFLMKDEIPAKVQKTLLGFASGVMVAASVWSLIIPSINMCESMGKLSVMPASIGFLLGMGFLLIIDMATPHLHIGNAGPEGPRSNLSKTAMLILAITLHNFPEGMAVGMVIAGYLQGGTNISISAVIAMAIGIAIQNIPEGAIVSMPMKAAGNSRRRSFFIGSLSGAVEPIGADRCHSRNASCEHSNPVIALHACIRRRCHDIRSHRRTDTRSFRRRTQQLEYHWFCNRFRPDDDT